MKYVLAVFAAIITFIIVMLFGEFAMYVESLMSVKTDLYFTFHRIVNTFTGVMIATYIGMLVVINK